MCTNSKRGAATATRQEKEVELELSTGKGTQGEGQGSGGGWGDGTQSSVRQQTTTLTKLFGIAKPDKCWRIAPTERTLRRDITIRDGIEAWSASCGGQQGRGAWQGSDCGQWLSACNECERPPMIKCKCERERGRAGGRRASTVIDRYAQQQEDGGGGGRRERAGNNIRRQPRTKH